MCMQKKCLFQIKSIKKPETFFKMVVKKLFSLQNVIKKLFESIILLKKLSTSPKNGTHPPLPPPPRP